MRLDKTIGNEPVGLESASLGTDAQEILKLFVWLR